MALEPKAAAVWCTVLFMSRTDRAADIGLQPFEHEELRVIDGPRSGATIAVAVHSTARGPAIGGCRIRSYPRWRDGIDDVLRLSKAMTLKCVLADLPHGGGKTVAVLPDASTPGDGRRDLIADIADAVAQLDGRYITGPDIGSTSQDMALIHSLAHGWAFCRPEAQGGSGDSSVATARGVIAALNAAVAHVYDKDSVSGLRVGVIGFGSVGRLVSQRLAADGADVIVSDINTGLRPDVEGSAANWTTSDLLHEQLDVLVPAAAGGLLNSRSATTCQTPLIVGPANNQLANDEVAPLLQQRGITWVPDVVASAGGIIHAVCREELGLDETATGTRIDAIGAKVMRILEDARARSISPLLAACYYAGECRPG